MPRPPELYANTIRPYKTSVLSAFIACALIGCVRQHPDKAQSDAESALSSFVLPEGFKIELLASEPLLGDPVDMEIDEFGQLYVVEMPGYPLDKSGTGKIKLLFDKDGDGQMDSSLVYADNLVLPNSVMRWKKGVLVTDAPYVLYFEDRDHDGRAEVRDTVLTGFALSNPQHNLNSPLPGIDNWIYLAHEGAVSTEMYSKEFGDPGSAIRFPNMPSAHRLAVNASSRSVRFNPDTHQLEETSGHSQFGHTFDQWGHHFLVGNANHIFLEMIAARYLRRNKQLLISESTESVSDHGEAAEVFPITTNPQHQLLTDVGVITSACGLMTYLGGGFPPPYDENTTFVAEPVSNLVHVDKLKPTGSSFVASRILEHQEFLASRDAKFRPVNLYTGPDGALYVVDYYRQIIEHPEWMGEEVVQSGALYNDSDRGRIYRITPKVFEDALWTKGLPLGKASTAELVEHLSDKNAWWRMHAQRLLVDRRDTSVVESLQTLAKTGTPSVGRLHALWTLEGMRALRTDDIILALKDSEAGVRENAIKLAELHLREKPAVTPSLLALAHDPDAHVRYQLLCTLGDIASPEADTARKQVLFQDVADPWVQIAALSCPSLSIHPLLTEVMERAKQKPELYRSLIEKLGSMVAKGNDTRGVENIIREATLPSESIPATAQAAVIHGMAIGREGQHASPALSREQKILLTSAIFNHPSTAVGNAALRLLATDGGPAGESEFTKKAMQLAVDHSAEDSRRALAVAFLGSNDPIGHRDLFLNLLSTHEPLTVQLAALRSLSRIPGTGVSEVLIRQWGALTPEVHDAAIATFLHDDDRVALLLQAIQQNKIPASSVAWPRRVGLMAQSNPALRDIARKLFTNSDDEQIRKTMATVLELKGDAIQGKLVYQQNCALCHQIRGSSGLSLGPDLGTVHNWSPEAILSNVVNPSRSISSGFDLCRIELVNGESVQGLIASESSTAITLRNNGSAERTINRNEVKSLTALNMSIMPADFAQRINPEQMADLLAYLKQNK